MVTLFCKGQLFSESLLFTFFSKNLNENSTWQYRCVEKSVEFLDKSVSKRTFCTSFFQNTNAKDVENTKINNQLLYLNYYLSYDVCACFRLSVCLSANFFFSKLLFELRCLCVFPSLCPSVFLQKNFSSKMDQICKFGEQISRIQEFKPEGLDF